MSHVSEFPLRPASSRRLLAPAVALFFAAAVVVVLSLLATNGPEPVLNRSAQGGACAAPYPHPRGVAPPVPEQPRRGRRLCCPVPAPARRAPLYQNSGGEGAAPPRALVVTGTDRGGVPPRSVISARR
jgi:hypothetical protein